MNAVTVYGRDCVLHKRSPVKLGHRTKLKGECCGAYSKETADALSFLANNCMERWTAMLLLTYPADWPRDGLVVRRHLGRFLDALRRRCPGVRYIWVREYQERNAPHFHILVNVPRGTSAWRWRPSQKKSVEIDPKLDKWACDAWAAAVGHECEIPPTGLVVSWEYLRDTDGGQKYLAKYASKLTQKQLPEEVTSPGRWWMASRKVKAVPLRTFRVSDSHVYAVMGGKERAWNGETYRVLHGASQRWVDWMWAGGRQREIRPVDAVRGRHPRGCSCMTCAGWSGRERLTPAPLIGSMEAAQKDNAAQLWARYFRSNPGLSICAAWQAKSDWQRIHVRPDGRSVFWLQSGGIERSKIPKRAVEAVPSIVFHVEQKTSTCGQSRVRKYSMRR